MHHLMRSFMYKGSWLEIAQIDKELEEVNAEIYDLLVQINLLHEHRRHVMNIIESRRND